VSVILTADRTLMSSYHNSEFLGFGTAAPPNLLPERVFQALFFPPMKTVEGIVPEAPYALRKIEAQLLNEGFDVKTVDPDHLNNYLNEAKVLGIHAMDPFGLGPASTTFSRILKTGEPYLSKYFRMLFQKPEIRDAARRGLKIIIGGPGAWQFKYRKRFLDNYGIDCVVDGEAEIIVGDLFKRALNGEELPQFYDVDPKDVPDVDEIPNIRHPSINGLIEIGRGCCRGCHFCNVTLRPLRWYPYEKVKREMKVNIAGGVNNVILQAEDALLYGSRNTTPNRDKVLELTKVCKRTAGSVSWSHVSMAAVATDPKLVAEAAEIVIDERQEWWGTEIGLETGSPELLRKAMPAKAHPFKPEEWPSVVIDAAGVLNDHNLVPAYTLIVGLEQETDEDVRKTIELVDNLKDFRSLIVPLFFTPLGRLKNKNWFMAEQMNNLHEELLMQCVKHDIYWSKTYADSYFKGNRLGWALSPLYKLLIMMADRKARVFQNRGNHLVNQVLPYA
jgi:radical SAM superfamily enzyme YgiQ (UPF0313 family)